MQVPWDYIKKLKLEMNSYHHVVLSKDQTNSIITVIKDGALSDCKFVKFLTYYLYITNQVFLGILFTYKQLRLKELESECYNMLIDYVKIGNLNQKLISITILALLKLEFAIIFRLK